MKTRNLFVKGMSFTIMDTFIIVVYVFLTEKIVVIISIWQDQKSDFWGTDFL